MFKSSSWEKLEWKLISDLRKITVLEELKNIEPLCQAMVKEIIGACPNDVNNQKKYLSLIRRLIRVMLPHDSKSTAHYPVFDSNGNPNGHEHLALKYLCLTEEKELMKLSDLKIQQLEFDNESKLNVLSALEQLGEDLAKFIQTSCKIRAKTVLGKSKKYNAEDLSTVLTKELLLAKNKDYRSHPKRIAELTRRAIKAIQIHNGSCNEINQKWFISATAINGLTGSRIYSINKVLKNYRQMVDDHNKEHGLEWFSNRGNKRQIDQDIDIHSLAPHGKFTF